MTRQVKKAGFLTKIYQKRKRERGNSWRKRKIEAKIRKKLNS
jgi:hypothetical protein